MNESVYAAPTQAMEAALAKVRDRREITNTHPSMLRTRTISASRLIKATARELAKEILLDDQTQDPEDAHWATNGNALAAMNLVGVECQEPSLRFPLPAQGPGTIPWMLTGHADGLAYHDAAGKEYHWSDPLGPAAGAKWWGTVYENKAPLHDYDDYQVDKAYRQGLLYLAMAMHGINDEMSAAAWLNEARVWIQPTLRFPGQVVVCLTPYDSPKREVAFPVTREACDAHFDRYVEKAVAVIQAVEADDVEVAGVLWDDVKDKGLDEFDSGDVPELTDQDLAHAVEEERMWAATKKEAEENHALVKEALERVLRSKGLEEVKVNGYRVVLQRSRGGLRHFIQAPSTSLRVYGGPKKPKPAA